MLTELGRCGEGNAETEHARHSVQRIQMLLGERERIQRGQARRAPPVFDAQLSSDMSKELGRAILHWQRAAQQQQFHLRETPPRFGRLRYVAIVKLVKPTKSGIYDLFDFSKSRMRRLMLDRTACAAP